MVYLSASSEGKNAESLINESLGVAVEVTTLAIIFTASIRLARMTAIAPFSATHKTSIYVLDEVTPKDCIKESWRAFLIAKTSEGGDIEKSV